MSAVGAVERADLARFDYLEITRFPMVKSEDGHNYTIWSELDGGEPEFWDVLVSGYIENTGEVEVLDEFDNLPESVADLMLVAMQTKYPTAWVTILD